MRIIVGIIAFLALLLLIIGIIFFLPVPNLHNNDNTGRSPVSLNMPDEVIDIQIPGSHTSYTFSNQVAGYLPIHSVGIINWNRDPFSDRVTQMVYDYVQIQKIFQEIYILNPGENFQKQRIPDVWVHIHMDTLNNVDNMNYNQKLGVIGIVSALPSGIKNDAYNPGKLSADEYSGFHTQMQGQYLRNPEIFLNQAAKKIAKLIGHTAVSYVDKQRNNERLFPKEMDVFIPQDSSLVIPDIPFLNNLTPTVSGASYFLKQDRYYFLLETNTLHLSLLKLISWFQGQNWQEMSNTIHSELKHVNIRFRKENQEIHIYKFQRGYDSIGFSGKKAFPDYLTIRYMEKMSDPEILSVYEQHQGSFTQGSHMILADWLLQSETTREKFCTQLESITNKDCLVYYYLSECARLRSEPEQQQELLLHAYVFERTSFVDTYFINYKFQDLRKEFPSRNWNKRIIEILDQYKAVPLEVHNDMEVIQDITPGQPIYFYLFGKEDQLDIITIDLYETDNVKGKEYILRKKHTLGSASSNLFLKPGVESPTGGLWHIDRELYLQFDLMTDDYQRFQLRITAGD